jgi:hypothetical protein
MSDQTDRVRVVAQWVQKAESDLTNAEYIFFLRGHLDAAAGDEHGA